MRSYYVDITRLFALVALAISTALLANQLRSAPQLCSFNAGCQQVLSSSLGGPLPAIGCLGFGTVLAVSFCNRRWAPVVLRCLGLVAGSGGAILILVQVVVLGHFCPYCLVTDCAAIGIGIIAILRGTRAFAPVTGYRIVWWGAGALALSLLGLALGPPRSHGENGQPGSVPPEIAALWLPDKVNVIEVVDFECPQCRRMHAVLERFLEEHRARVHFVQLAAPMPGHAQARDAAHAFLCAQEQGKGDEMARALFEARSLQPRDFERLASFLGVSISSFRTCMTRWDLDQTLDANVALARSISPEGLPVIWVQDRKLSGVQPMETLRHAVEIAERSAGNAGP
jgi:uncharacterized membrane protein/predicted DsbA family dithiol-disulfide isomerase